jgi:hypothetical protein
MSGNRLGGKVKAQYVADNGSTYVLRIDADLVISNSGLVLGTIGGTPPKRFKPRIVHAQFVDTDGKIYRKQFIAGAADAALYATSTPQVVTCDGVAFTTTGRRGEVQTFA